MIDRAEAMAARDSTDALAHLVLPLQSIAVEAVPRPAIKANHEPTGSTRRVNLTVRPSPRAAENNDAITDPPCPA